MYQQQKRSIGVPLSKVLWIAFFVIASLGLEACRSASSRTTYRPQETPQNVWTQKNSRINKFLKIYTDKSNKTVMMSLKRAQPYLPYIRNELKKRNLPPELAFLPMLESSFNPKAKSQTGALGMWQFTKGTARDYGLRVGWIRDERLNWQKSTRAALDYLDRLNKKFKNNWELALAAYNGGPGYIERSMKKQRTGNFWKLKLRKESHEYVPKFIAMLQVARKKYPHLYKLQT